MSHCSEFHIMFNCVKFRKITFNYSFSQLSCAIKTKVKEYDCVIFSNSFIIKESWFYEFIIFIVGISIFYRFFPTGTFFSFATHNRSICKLSPVPSSISIHSKISSNKTRNPTNTNTINSVL